MKKTIYKGSYIAKTDVGMRRSTNEDVSMTLANANGDVLLLVADGMGGHNKGSFASSTVKEVVTEEFNKKQSFFSVHFAYMWLQKVLKLANKTIYTKSIEDPEYEGMGTTVVVALLIRNKVILASAGDSRIYIAEKTELKQMTEDQTKVNHLVKIGAITEEEARVRKDRHVLTNAVGIFPSLSLDMKIVDNLGKSIVLCSDGLYNNISISELFRALSVNESPSQKTETVIKIANANGGSDNISIAYWEAFK